MRLWELATALHFDCVRKPRPVSAWSFVAIWKGNASLCRNTGPQLSLYKSFPTISPVVALARTMKRGSPYGYIVA